MLQPSPVLQSELMEPPWSWPRGDTLPGTAPVASDDWLRVDDAYEGQMALRDQLLAERPVDVLGIVPEGMQAAQEALAEALRILPGLGEFQMLENSVRRPDGVTVQLDWDQPLLSFGRLVQEDLCLHLKSGGQHRLVGAVLCFPASWTLSEKLGHPLTRIHLPVAEYDDGIARRVQRLFDGLRAGTVIRRANCLAYDGFELFTPRSEQDRREIPGSATARYIRTERQCLFKLPKTGAVAFSIHTCVVDRLRLPPKELASAQAYLDRD